MEAAIVQHAAVAAHGAGGGHVDLHALRDHGAVGDGELQLVGDDGHGQVFLQQRHLVGVLVGDAEVVDLAGRLEGGEGLGDLDGIHQRVGAVEQQRVEVVDAQALEDAVDGI